MGFDLHGELAAALRDPAGAWRFIRGFAKAYGVGIRSGDGNTVAELDAAEKRLGVALPAAVRDAYRLFGRRDDLTRVQDRLLTPQELELADDGRLLVFRAENQYVTRWGVRLTGEPDPPVLFLDDKVWRPFLDRFSSACVELVLFEWTMGGTEEDADNRELADDEITAVAKRFRRLPMPDYPQWSEPDGPPTRWYEGDGAVLRVDIGDWLWVRAGSAEAIAAVRQAFPGDWLMSEPDG
jgi:hypothetical protein